MTFDYYELIKLIYSNADPKALEFGINFAKNVMIIIFIIILFILILSWIKIFKKANIKAWKALIPGYNLIKLYQISGINPIFILTFFIMFINKISLIGFIIWNIVDATQKAKLAKKFGRSIYFIIGMIFFDYIFYPILAFGKSKYDENGRI